MNSLDLSATARAVDYALQFGPIDPRDYQWEAHHRSIEHFRDPETGTQPAYVDASVGAGKTINIGMLAKHISDKNGTVLVLARQGELIEQNAADAWLMDCKNSTFSAALGVKSTHYPVVMGTEGTVCRALHKQLLNYRPHAILIDECFTGDTLIDTDKGKVPIMHLVGNHEKYKVHCMDMSNGDISLDNPVRVFSNGVKSISHVKTTNGVIKCTNTHLFWSNGSWTEAQNLKHGDELTLNGSQDFVLRKLLRASAAVATKLFHLLAKVD